MAISWRTILAISFIQALWGGNPVAVKFGLLVFPPLWSGFLRFSIAILCILVWARIKGIPMMLKRNELKPFSLMGFIFFIQIWLMNAGFNISSGAISAVLISTYPLFAAFFPYLKSTHLKTSNGKSKLHLSQGNAESLSSFKIACWCNQ